MSRDLERIRLATARFWELQGLRHVLVGTVFVVVFGGVLLGGAVGRVFVAAAALALVLIVAGMVWLDRYYERTFGRLRPTASNRRFGTLIVPATLIALLWLHPLVGAPPYSLYFLGWAAFGLWIVGRDWPFRAHHLIDTAAGLLGAIVQWRVPAGAEEAGFLSGLVIIGAAAIVSGTLDHRLLSDIVRPSRADAAEPAPERP